MHPFLSGRLGVMRCSSMAGWGYHIWCVYQERHICPEIKHQVTLTGSPMFNVPYRPIEPPFLSGWLEVMGVFLTGRLGVSHIMDISRDDYLSRNNTSGPPDMVFNVSYAQSPHTAAVPHWPVGSLPYKTDIGIEWYGQILHILAPRLFSMFDVFHVPRYAVKCIHSWVASWE